jgi:hypothetical protein
LARERSRERRDRSNCISSCSAPSSTARTKGYDAGDEPRNEKTFSAVMSLLRSCTWERLRVDPGGAVTMAAGFKMPGRRAPHLVPRNQKPRPPAI